MSNDKLKSEANPSLVVLRDNKPKWYLPETRSCLLYTSDAADE